MRCRRLLRLRAMEGTLDNMVGSMVDSTVVNMAASNMVVNNTVASNIMDSSRVRMMRLSRWPRRACLGCSRSLVAVRLCKAVVDLLLCRLQRVTWRAEETFRARLIPADWMKR